MSEIQNREPYKIPPKNSFQESKSSFTDYKSSEKTTDLAVSFEFQHFAEIEIDDGMNTSYKPSPIPKQAYPVMDEKRRLFKSMREIAWNNHTSNIMNLKFYNKQTQYENSRVFYKQAIFMKDVEDDYNESVPFSSYYPYYQLMTYEQLRTYFTWRTKIRRGIIEKTSLSYVFVYVYELLNNIGVNDPLDGLDKLMSFRNTYKKYDTTIDKYLIKWIKDYHVYYMLPHSFKEFLCENKLESYYPEIAGYEPEMDYNFEYLCGVSKYNITRSAFYNNTTSQLIAECFDFVISRLKSILEETGIRFKDLIFQTSKNKSVWAPFKGALFYQTYTQPDRKVILSKDEIYICSQNIWYFCMLNTADGGKDLIGYIMKQLEAVLRKLTGYKYKLSANPNSVNNELVQRLNDKGFSLEKVITDAVIEFYKEKNKTVVSVDVSALHRIRLESQDTQEKLIVPENNSLVKPISYVDVLSKNTKKDESSLFSQDKVYDKLSLSSQDRNEDKLSLTTQDEIKNILNLISQDNDMDQLCFISQDKDMDMLGLTYQDEDMNQLCFTSQGKDKDMLGLTYQAEDMDKLGLLSPDKDKDENLLSSQDNAKNAPHLPHAASALSGLSTSDVPSLSGGWTSLGQVLNEIEINALLAVLQGNRDIKHYADENDIMLEVLADSINEKAFDHIGDNILELSDSMTIYDEYKDKIMILVGLE